MILYCVMYFSSFVPDAELRYKIGFGYLAIVCSLAFIHLTIMLTSACCKTRLLFKRCKNRGCSCFRSKKKAKIYILETDSENVD